MAQFFALAPLNADTFESGNAPAGHVLTADGNGGASWQAPAGGSGPIDTNAIQGLIRYTWTQLASPDGETLTGEFVTATNRQPLDGDGLIYFDTNEGGAILCVFFDGEWYRYYFW